MVKSKSMKNSTTPSGKQKTMLSFFSKKKKVSTVENDENKATGASVSNIHLPKPSPPRVKLDSPIKPKAKVITIESDSESVVPQKRKRIAKNKVLMDSSDEEEEWTPTATTGTPAVETDDDEPSQKKTKKDFSIFKSPAFQGKKVMTQPATSFKTPKAAPVAGQNGKNKKVPNSAPPRANPSKSSAKASGGGTSDVFGLGQHFHDELSWLQPDALMDKMRRKPSDADFDPRTLYVPPSFIKTQTPAMKQWWELKKDNMDTVLFFKVGKFYELFHMDADIGFQVLDHVFMRGKKAHTGFPELAYAKTSSKLVEAGYRVARVEQTETPEMMKKRAPKDKVVRREVCSILTPGTNTQCFLDGRREFKGYSQCTDEESNVGSESWKQNTQSLLLSLSEKRCSEDELHYGVCITDCSTGEFQLGQISDSTQRDSLRTLITQFDIAEIVHEQRGLEDDTLRVLKHAHPSALFTVLKTTDGSLDCDKTIAKIREIDYFEGQPWPAVLQECLVPNSFTVKDDKKLSVAAFGACTTILHRGLIDHQLVGMKNFRDLDSLSSNAASTIEDELDRDYAILDVHTIHNLELLRNTFDGKIRGSLLHLMDKTTSSFGRRLFREWLLKPLCRPVEINSRLDAVEELVQNMDEMEDCRAKLRKIPDLQRLLCRIHSLGSNVLVKDHPNSRAVMFEAASYNKRKIRDFEECIRGLRLGMEMVQYVDGQCYDFSSKLLLKLLKINHGNEAEVQNSFPDLTELLVKFESAYNRAKAKEGIMSPMPGVDGAYDNACEKIDLIKDQLDDVLKAQQKALKCSRISYWIPKKREDRYQMEVPEEVVRNQPSEFELKSKKKGFKRFHTPEIRKLLKELMEAEDRKEDLITDFMRRLFHQFSEHYALWDRAITCLSNLDCLLSLAVVSCYGEGYTRPIVSTDNVQETGPVLYIENGVHPCVASTFNGGEFIPNDTHLGNSSEHGDAPKLLLLSGANMGGKSTYLRQNCLIVLMAQMGCFVPASKCIFSPVDRIFTRLGACDRILEGQSTFYVELSETSTILNSSTRHSLVILDELGRGTSTFDGTAIAYAVIDHLVNRISCRTMFATHYHSLLEEYVYDPQVLLGHMSCNVEDDRVAFLYKLAPGTSPKSYGINVARLAGMPDDVLARATRVSSEFEAKLLKCSSRSNKLAEESYNTLVTLVKELKSSEENQEALQNIRKLWQQLRTVDLQS